jgi:hypothetical protein
LAGRPASVFVKRVFNEETPVSSVAKHASSPSAVTCKFAGDAQAIGDEGHGNRDGKPHLVDGVIRTKDGAGDFEDDSAGG